MIVRREATLPAAPGEIWALISDPQRLPAWWPGVSRVEDASAEAWTKVFTSPKGKAVRADYTRIEADAEERLVWRQEVEASPFERVLAAATIEILLARSNGGTHVTIALDQRPRGWARFAPLQFRAAGRRQVEEALQGLERLFA